MTKTILVDARNTLFTSSGVNTELVVCLDEFTNTKIVVTNANSDEKKQFGIVETIYEVFSLEHNPNKTDPHYFIQLLELK
jgi:predicted DNA-binding protein with PD1-like motif